MIHGILGDGYTQWHLNWSANPLTRDFVTKLDLNADFDCITDSRRFPQNIFNGCSQPTGDTYSSRHLVISNLGFTFLLNMIPVSSDLKIIPDFEFRTNLRTSFCVYTTELIWIVIMKVFELYLKKSNLLNQNPSHLPYHICKKGKRKSLHGTVLHAHGRIFQFSIYSYQ